MTKRKNISRAPTMRGAVRVLWGDLRKLIAKNSEARRSGKPVSPTAKGEPDMKQRRVTIDLEIETSLTAAQLRKRKTWQSWLSGSAVTVVQVGANVIRASKAASKAKPAKKKAKASR